MKCNARCLCCLLSVVQLKLQLLSLSPSLVQGSWINFHSYLRADNEPRQQCREISTLSRPLSEMRVEEMKRSVWFAMKAKRNYTSDEFVGWKDETLNAESFHSLNLSKRLIESLLWPIIKSDRLINNPRKVLKALSFP